MNMVNHCSSYEHNRVKFRWLEEAKYPVTRTRVSGNKIRGHHIVTCRLKLINKIEMKKKRTFSIEINYVELFGVG